MKIYASKQVGNVSYMCSDIYTLIQIIESEEIWSSAKPERNPNTHEMQHYVSLSRNLTSAAIRNNKKWKYGIILDGNKLSNRYSIEPFSYAYNHITSKGYKVRSLTAYQDGTYRLACDHWPTIVITKQLHDEIEAIIENMSEEDKVTTKYQYTTGGKRRVYNTYIKERHHFNGRHGGPRISSKNLSEQYQVQFSKNPISNESEERIWLKGSKSVDISNCILGVIMPKKEYSDFEVESYEIYRQLKSALEHSVGHQFDVELY